MPEQRPPDETDSDDFLQQVDAPRPGLLREFWHFLKHNKKWWLLPILLALLVLGVLVILSGTGLGPFIYPMI